MALAKCSAFISISSTLLEGNELLGLCSPKGWKETLLYSVLDSIFKTGHWCLLYQNVHYRQHAGIPLVLRTYIYSCCGYVIDSGPQMQTLSY